MISVEDIVILIDNNNSVNLCELVAGIKIVESL